MELNKFLETSKKVAEITGAPVKQTEVEELTIVGKRIWDEVYARPAFERYVYLEHKETLLVAPPGSGKTYAIVKTFEHMQEVFENAVFMLVTPNKIQNIQNQEEYGITAIVGDTHMDDYDLTKTRTFSVVVDKVKEVFEQIPADKNIGLVVDEAHLLIAEAIDYRAKAIKELQEVIDKVLSRKGTVLYMTATPEPLVYKQFDKVVTVKMQEHSAPADVIDWVTIPQEITFRDGLIQILREYIEKGYRPLVRLNNTNQTNQICEILHEKFGYIVLNVDSKQKDVLERFSENGKTKSVYKNLMYNNIVNLSTLPDKEKEMRIDCYFTTSMLEVGTSIEGIGAKENKDPKIMPIFVVTNSEDLTFTGIEQFFNRIRYHVERYGIVIKDVTESTHNLINLPGWTRIESERVKKTIGELSIMYPSLKRIYGNDTDYAKWAAEGMIIFLLQLEDKKLQERKRILVQEVQEHLDAKSVQNDRNHMSCIHFDVEHESFFSDPVEFWKVVYDKYVHQRYFFPGECQKIIQDMTGIDVVEVEHTEDFFSEEKMTSKKRERCKELLLGFAANDDAIQRFVQQKEIIPQFQELKSTDMWTDVLRLTNIGVKPKESMLLVAEGNKKAIREKEYKILVEKHFIPTKEKHQSILFDCMLNPEKIDQLKDYSLRNELKIIRESELGEEIARSLKLGVNARTIIERIDKSDNVKTLRDYNDEMHIKNLNAYYLAGYVNCFPGKAGMEHLIVLECLYKLNTAGNMVQTTLTQNVLDYVADKLNTDIRMFRYKRRGYDGRDVVKWAQKIFKTRRVKKCVQLIDLKLPRNLST